MEHRIAGGRIGRRRDRDRDPGMEELSRSFRALCRRGRAATGFAAATGAEWDSQAAERKAVVRFARQCVTAGERSTPSARVRVVGARHSLRARRW